MCVIGHFHDPISLSQGIEAPLPTVEEAEWARESIVRFWRKDKFFLLSKIQARFPGRVALKSSHYADDWLYSGSELHPKSFLLHVEERRFYKAIVRWDMRYCDWQLFVLRPSLILK